MCIIAAKAANIPMPSRETIRTMWNGNRDGAGFMYVEKGKVRIEKGFMTYESFEKALNKLEARLDLTRTPVVMHFRITTHGGTKPENCHPFPITDSIGALKKLTCSTDLGVAHNGIIPITPRRGISDTMEYIASQLAPLKRAMPRFYTNKDAMLLVKNAIESRMAFLTGDGKIYTVGDFIKDEGVLYSNSSYKETRLTYRSLDNWDCWSDTDPNKDPWDWNAAEGWGDVATLMWLPEDAYLKDKDGALFEVADHLMDESGRVYEYDWELDAAVLLEGVTAHTAEGTPVAFDFEEAEPLPLL